MREVDDALFLESDCSAQRAFLARASKVASAECPVLLRGESGTGKSVMARWLHDHSPRSGGPFVTVNCPALSGDLMTSALFGHRRGAFTGAHTDVEGKVQHAEKGTLFLDEIGDLSHEAQARLLRFLNDRAYERLGEAAERRADVRVIAATSRPLESEVRAGRFREDLLFRIHVVSLVCPPLRERRDDVLPLARSFLDQMAQRHRRARVAFSSAAERAICAYAWPGNVRELKNAVERAVVLAPSFVIEPEDLALAPASLDSLAIGDAVPLEAVERAHIERVFASSGSIEAAARVLGMHATTLLRKRRRYGLG
jgi:NtrC-family two-component system response regulator AlgB